MLYSRLEPGENERKQEEFSVSGYAPVAIFTALIIGFGVVSLSAA